jgi:hypothetical protein
MYGNLTSFQKLLNAAVLINKETSGIKTDNYGALAHGVFTRCLINSITLSNIIFPRPLIIKSLSPNPIVLYDLSSSYLIVRSLFESYVNVYYVLEANSSEEEKEFKYLLWDRHSLAERSKMAQFRNVTNQKLEDEQKEILAINKKIFQNNYYLSLESKKQEFFKNNEKWTNLTFIDRGIIAGVSEKKVRFLYKLFSSYAHSESFSTMQFNSVSSMNQAKGLIEGVPLSFTEAFLCLICDFIRIYFKEAENILKSDPILTDIIYFYKQYLRK